MIKAKTYPDFKEFVKGFIANVKAGKRYDFRTYQAAVLPLTYSSPWPEADIAEVTNFTYVPDYDVPFNEELLYAIGSQMRTADFFMDLQYAIINGKDVDTVYCEWLARVKPFSMLNAKLKDAVTTPTITTQPTDQTVNEGEALTLTIVATNATGYQWKKGASNISGATSATYTKANVVPADAGSYTCVVSGAGGATVTSDAATVTVNALPVITQQPTAQEVSVGGTLSLSITATGATKYQWKKGGTSIGGATSTTYTKSNMTTTDAGSYTCTVTGSGGDVISDAAVVTVYEIPVITTQPTPTVSVTEGDSLSLSVVAEHATGYQWFKDGSQLTGETSATLNISPANVSDSGAYYCEVSGSHNSKVTSHESVVTVTAAP